MLQERFPELPDEGITATFSRSHALAHEDRRFLTREHPMARAALELMTGSHMGTSALVLDAGQALPDSSALLLEAVYVAECPAPPVLNAQRFLPPTARRMLIDEHGQERSIEIDPDALGGKCLRPRRPLARALLKTKSKVIEAMVALAEQEAARESQELARAGKPTDARAARSGARAAAGARTPQSGRAPRGDRGPWAERDALAETLANSRLRLDALRLIAFA